MAKYGEMALKGLNRGSFERVLLKNMRQKLKKIGSFDLSAAQSIVTVTPKDELYNSNDVKKTLGKIFGISAFSCACLCPKDMDKIIEKALEYCKEALLEVRTFKVNAKRADKKFPLISPEICIALGDAVLEKFAHLKVDVHNPELVITVDIRDHNAFVSYNSYKGIGGMPYSCNGLASLLVSGGIDSPVAGFMMAKRGVTLDFIHFFSFPYTSLQAKQKVITLTSILCEYTAPIRLHVVPFTKIQEAIRAGAPEELFTLIMRRYMMKISGEIAVKNGSSALITGESLGQVASQTIKSLAVTDEIAPIPVFRPLIGMDKEEIITIARKIGTFETSILPYEDCCTVFTPKHPKTSPKLEEILEAEAGLAIDHLVLEAIEQTEVQVVYEQ